ncbi:hypothetical protein BHM03_00043405 [Ensete ventricosum]|nr:hypothetical protein BHM03_00043405 [Ensete ventricosum]
MNCESIAVRSTCISRLAENRNGTCLAPDRPMPMSAAANYKNPIRFLYSSPVNHNHQTKNTAVRVVVRPIASKRRYTLSARRRQAITYTPLHSFGRGTADARRQAITYSASAVSRLAACRPAATTSYLNSASVSASAANVTRRQAIFIVRQYVERPLAKRV